MLSGIVPDWWELTSGLGMGVASSMVFAAAVVIGRVTVVRIRRHAVRRFWDSFRREALIMTTEYSVESVEGSPMRGRPDGIHFDRDKDQLIATRSTSGYVLSYGVAMALSSLLAYLQRDLRSTVGVMGDKGHSQPSDGKSLIVLGSPANNRYLPGLMKNLSADFPLLGRFSWQLGDSGLTLRLPNGEELTPSIDEHETGTDFALVISLHLGRRPIQRLVVVSGCNMWGTEAATRFLLNREKVKLLPRRVRRRSTAFAFLVRAWIVKGRPDRVDLHTTPGGMKVIDLRSAEFA